MLACSSSQATMTDALGERGSVWANTFKHANRHSTRHAQAPGGANASCTRAGSQGARHTGTWQCYLLRRTPYLHSTCNSGQLCCFSEKVLEKGQLHRPHFAKKRSCATLEPKSIAGAKVRPPYHGGFGHDECVTAHRPSAEDSRCCRRPRSHTRAHYSRPQMTLRTAMVATSLAPSQSPESSEAGTGTTACRPGPTSPRRRSSG